MTGYRNLAVVRSLYKQNLLRLVKTSRYDYWGTDVPDFNNTNSTSTYEDCLDIILHANEELEVVIWKGDALYGHRQQKQYSYTFVGEWQLIESLQDRIDHEFAQYCLMLMEIEEETRKTERAKAIGESLLLNYGKDNSTDTQTQETDWRNADQKREGQEQINSATG